MSKSSVSIISETVGVSDEPGCQTDDIRLAAALLAIGVAPKFERVGIQIVRPGRPGNWQEFFFESRTRCGKWSTQELMAGWAQGLPWIEKNPEHPWSYIMAALANHRDLTTYLRRGNEFAFLKKGRSVAMLPMNASAGLEAQILGTW